jgi:hypothetical protein
VGEGKEGWVWEDWRIRGRGACAGADVLVTLGADVKSLVDTGPFISGLAMAFIVFASLLFKSRGLAARLLAADKAASSTTGKPFHASPP